MYHILKAEIGKLFKSRTFLVCSIITVVMSLVLVISYKMMAQMYGPELIEQLNEQAASSSGVSVQASQELDFSFLQNF